MKKLTNICPQEFNKISEVVENIYEGIVVISKRAKQINAQLTEEINYKISEFVSIQDDIKEVFENQEQIKISKYYERLAKPVQVAIEELVTGELSFRYKDSEIAELTEAEEERPEHIKDEKKIKW